VEFDLSDMARWGGIKVREVRLLIHNEQMVNFDVINFTLLRTTMYESAPTATYQAVFKEAGPTGNIVGGYKLSGSTDNAKKTLEVELDRTVATEINKLLASSPKYYTFGIGMFVNGHQISTSSASARWKDIRLQLFFEWTTDLVPTKPGDGIAFGDDWSGYLDKLTSAKDNPLGHIYVKNYGTSSTEYRGYANWHIGKIRNVFPQENFTRVGITKVSVRFNHYFGTPSSIYLYHMKYNASDATVTDPNLFTDCGDGSLYYGPSTGSASTDAEYEWKLSNSGLNAFINAFEDGTPDFFGIGWTVKGTTGETYSFAPKLVIEWKLLPPPVKVLVSPIPVEGYSSHGAETVPPSVRLYTREIGVIPAHSPYLLGKHPLSLFGYRIVVVKSLHPCEARCSLTCKKYVISLFHDLSRYPDRVLDPFDASDRPAAKVLGHHGSIHLSFAVHRECRAGTRVKNRIIFHRHHSYLDGVKGRSSSPQNFVASPCSFCDPAALHLLSSST